MANYSAGDLNLTIQTISNDTIKSLDAVLGRLNLIEKGLGGTKSPRGGLFGFAKLGVNLYMMRRLGRAVGEIAQAGADYTETLNLWRVSMRDNLDVAEQFIDKMNKAYGISEKTLMNAQATFKNMVGSLGEIDSSTAYAISEGITQMALDYASLYNVTFESAFTKFQAVLAGQVRPIRSASGYDITENTLFALYQSLGGEKTMRQLSRTEKQLLSILAIFKQMDASGAVGDLKNTMGSFANQSRVWAEQLNQVKTWLGVIITYTIDESKLMINLNAAIMTVARYLEAVAIGIGAVKTFDKQDPFSGTEEGANDASDALDKLQGKLLDFDKFRAMNSSDGADIDLDQKVLDALKNYESITADAGLEARELSDKWLKILGFTIDENGELQLTNNQLGSAKDKIDGIINTLSTFDALGTIRSIFPFAETFFLTLAKTAPAIASIATATTPIIVNILETTSAIVTLLDKLGLLDDAIYTIIGIGIASKIIALTQTTSKFGTVLLEKVINPLINSFVYAIKYSLANFTVWLNSMDLGKTATIGFNAGLALLVANISLLALGWDKMSSAEKAIGIFGAIGSAALMAAAAVAAFHGSWTMGTAAVAIVGGLAAIAGAFTSFNAATKDLKFFANGASDIDGGTLFVAGEMGKTEAVYTGSNGKTNVANVQQMEAAELNALNKWWAVARKDLPSFASVNESGIYAIVDGEARRRGKRFANV